ncbi:bifunctional diguanylate cyclase/phosphodiesterase [Devosia chinhatensis]|uniref:bifunctional diguanylate cyclase/phosphodiesterase n=1 Tax=Devosia chinhatensis TaxID=429727 RepID=UPI00128E2DCA|nr:EAL domain-containing protein [Devosia chinhatensis]
MIDFFIVGHDLPFVLLAALVCLIATYACIGLMHHARQASGRMRHVWNGVSALSVGLGIWATHFIAVLAFRPGFALSYDPGLTALSLLIAILVCGGGIGLAVHSKGLVDRMLGGATVGVGISTMHYTGIASLMMQGDIGWHSGAVTLSILAGMALAALSFGTTLKRGWTWNLVAAGLLTAAICAMHFTAMVAADFSNCMAVVGSAQVDGGLMSLIVAFISILVLGFAIGSLVLDEADRRRTAREVARRAEDAARLAEANERLNLALTHMGQGLALFGSDGRMQLHNARLAELLGLGAAAQLAGAELEDVLHDALVGLGTAPEDAKGRVAELLPQHRQLIEGGGGELVQPVSDDRAFRIRHSPAGNGAFITTVEDISESRRNAAAIAHLAHHDSLTGLPNRARFGQLLGTALGALGGKGKLAVIALDLDRFKDINDGYGHAAGDEVLRELARRFGTLLKDGESVARLGGDEFAAIKPFTTLPALRDFLGRIEEALGQRVTYGENQLALGGSIGVAIAPQDGMDGSKLLNNADLALYRAKAEIDQRICYYEHDMDEAARQRRAMAKDLWTAVEKDGFHLAYQVQKSVTTGRITGYEVLLRWDRPGHGPVPPSEFIPLAEECGAISAIGAWVLNNACQEAARWPEPHRIAVNVSGLQLAQLELVDLVKSVLEQTGLAPARLELEVTETAIISDRQRALAVLGAIKALGVSIAIDDFGTGYSSLDTLRSFPFDKIKLDRSFMTEVERDEQAKAIVRAILALGKSLSVPVLAEGVETLEQLDVLRIEGCTEAQGFYLGRPGRIVWPELKQIA